MASISNKRQTFTNSARRKIAIYCALLAIMGASMSARWDQNSGDWTRRLRWEPDMAIPGRLQPGDKRVLLTRSLDLVYPETTLSWQDVVERATQAAELVAVVDAEVVTGTLAERDTWIATALKGKVRQVLWSNRAARVERGDHLVFCVSDGEMVINGVTVRALERSNKDIPHLRVRARYLLFMRRFDGVFYGTHDPLIVMGDTLRYASPLEIPGQPVNPLEGRTIQAVEQIIKRMSAK